MRPRTSPKLPLSPADGIVWPATKVIEAALNGKFTNSITAIGLLWLAARQGQLRQRWLAP
jgi:hypothetical protein